MKAVSAVNGVRQKDGGRWRGGMATMTTITLSVEDAVLEQACRLAASRAIPLEDLVAEMIRMLAESDVAGDPILGSMRDEQRAVDEMLAIVMKERERR